MTIVRLFVAAVAVIATVSWLSAQQGVVENSMESRFQLDLHVPDAAVTALLPQGFTMNVSAQGPAKDCNLRAIFVDRITINGPDGRPVGGGSRRFVYLAAPVKDPSGANAQLMIGGLVDDPSDAPGPFGVYLPATTHTMQRSTSSGGAGPVIDSQDWVFQAASGSSCTSSTSTARPTAATRRRRSSTPRRHPRRFRSGGRSRCSTSCET
jgi:hypothetical protein